MTMFEKATRLKLRFDSPKGALTTEDLWDLPLSSATSRANLDDIARGLHRELKATIDEVSFVQPVTAKADDELQLKFDVVKRVIEVRVAERDAAKALAERREKKQRIMELIAKKQDEKLSETSIEDLERMLEAV
jgi:hypothetical protein